MKRETVIRKEEADKGRAHSANTWIDVTWSWHHGKILSNSIFDGKKVGLLRAVLGVLL
jgi:hypothetical protein